MKLHFMGKFNLDPESLPHGEHKPNAVKFKEAEDSQKLSKIVGIASVIFMIIFAIPVIVFRVHDILWWQWIVALLATYLVAFPHEILHAICFKGDAYLYTNFKQGMLFVVGTEDMSKFRFIFMSLLPNIIFGFIPYTLGFVFPSLAFLSVFGALTISMGCGDYYNVKNAITQMPKGSRTYLYGFNSYWYIPEKYN